MTHYSVGHDASGWYWLILHSLGAAYTGMTFYRTKAAAIRAAEAAGWPKYDAAQEGES